MRWIYDVEIFPNFFCVYFTNYDTDEELVFEISERQNQYQELYKFLKQVKYLIGFNSINYDNLIINYLLKNFRKLQTQDYIGITKELKILNDLIIYSEEADYKKYSYLKYNQPFKSIDLFLYWSKLLRISKKLSLKSLAVNINWHKIQDLPYSPDHIVKLDEIDEIIKYNKNDVDITRYLAKVKMNKDIKLRHEAHLKYGFDCMSWDGVKLGLNILVKRYAERVGLDFESVSELRTVRGDINIGDIILPIINFKEGDCSYIEFVEDDQLIRRFKSFYGLYTFLKNLTVRETNEINCQVLYKGNRYDVKSGGLHTYHNPQLVIPKANEYYKDKDVSSYYPSLGADWNLIPEHLGVEFAEELGAIKSDRLQLKAKGMGKSSDAELLKLSMNGGFYGNTNNEHTPMQDRKCMLSITINGQLMLLMLCERLMEIGVKIDMCNTDGITILYDKALDPQVEEICKEWEKQTRTELETVDYVKVARMNINNYLAIYKDGDKIKVKQKGLFLTDPPMDQSRDSVVIAKALEAYILNNTPVEDFIYNHDNIFDFCSCKRVDKKYRVFWNGKSQQRINRYYVSNNGAYLYKQKPGGNLENMLKGFGVTVFNKFEKKEMKDYNINYNYYIAEAKKLIHEIEPNQLSLF